MDQSKILESSHHKLLDLSMKTIMIKPKLQPSSRLRTKKEKKDDYSETSISNWIFNDIKQ